MSKENENSCNSVQNAAELNNRKPVNLPQEFYDHQVNRPPPSDEELGPLPPEWERAVTENGETYFIDHSSGTSHWLDPRLSKFQKKCLEECLDDELPYGWEKIIDPQYGTYFIDHVNRRTQYENPVLQAKQAAEKMINSKRASFTRNPDELFGKRLVTSLIKSSRGLGFTIVGGDDDVEEFLQIKSVVPNGPAWHDGRLKTGDVIVYVGDICVLGYTHNQIVRLFQSIVPGETVTVEVCRGYSLPFDPNDPNTQVVTTIAVDVHATQNENAMNSTLDGNYNLDSTLEHSNLQKSDCNSMDALNTEGKNGHLNANTTKSIVNITIVKGSLGFGFTIADSACGQRVKKILDRQRCKNLLEGDILIEINNTTVRNMCHDNVVQVLKNCPYNEEAIISVQRGNATKTTNARPKNKTKDVRYNIRDLQTVFRSKTPTADLYSTQQKEILPNRPKTPLIDTRNRIKTPVGNISTSSIASSKSLNQNDANMYEGIDQELNQLNLTDMAPDDRDEFYKFQLHGNNCFCFNCKRVKTPTRMDHVFEREDNTNLSPKLSGLDYINENNPNIYQTTRHDDMFHPTSQSVDTFTPSQNIETFEPTQMIDSLRASRSIENFGLSPSVDNFTHSPSIDSFVPSPSIDSYGLPYNDAYARNTIEPIRSAPHEMPLNDCHLRLNIPKSTASSDSGMANVTRVPIVHNGQVCIDSMEFSVKLVRHDTGFGFRIIGGTEEGSQVAVGHIVPGGAAHLDQRIHTGDEILYVDGTSVVNTSHHQVVNLMGMASARGMVILRLRRRYNQPQRPIPYMYDVVVQRMENEGFGFVIISSLNKAGSTIGRLIEGSPAERCGRLRVGDQIVAVNHIDIRNLCHGDIVNLIKDSGYLVTLSIPHSQPP